MEIQILSLHPYQDKSLTGKVTREAFERRRESLLQLLESGRFMEIIHMETGVRKGKSFFVT